MIKPTVGRVVWFHNQGIMKGIADHGSQQPMAATVAYVFSDRMVNLSVVDHAGVQFAHTSVPLVQDDESPPAGQVYCEWMPYQKGQASSTQRAELEAELAKLNNRPTVDQIQQLIERFGNGAMHLAEDGTAWAKS